MKPYQHILIALDFTEGYHEVVDRGLDLRGDGCRLSILYCLEPYYYPEAYVGNLAFALHQQATESAEQKLQALLVEKNIEINHEDIVICTGDPGYEIRHYAEKEHADLVVVGGHAKHGFRLLLGSTSQNVVRHAHYDVLTVALT